MASYVEQLEANVFDLVAERDRLREALKRIATPTTHGITNASQCSRIAREALAGPTSKAEGK